MANDVKGIVREVRGFSKIPDDDGDQFMEVAYKLKPVDLTFLQKIFHIDLNDPDEATIDMIYEFEVRREQAKALQPYVIDGVIDIDKYDFFLGCYAEKSEYE